jgi:hypothetical protein
MTTSATDERRSNGPFRAAGRCLRRRASGSAHAILDYRQAPARTTPRAGAVLFVRRSGEGGIQNARGRSRVADFWSFAERGYIAAP